ARLIRIVLVLTVLLIVVYRWVNPPITPLMLVRLAETGKLAQNSVSLASISPDLPRGLIASEDGRFCLHRGVSWEPNPDSASANPGFLGNAESITLQTAQSLFLWPGNGPVVRLLGIGLAYAIDFA